MNKQEFMNKLEQLLADIPEDERAEALNYYEDYFLDAGEENEASIIEELESPEKVALNIKEGLGDAYKVKGEFSENGFSGYANDSMDEIANNIPSSEERGFTQKKPRKQIGALTIILLILASPFLIAIAAVLFSLFVALIATIFALLIAGIATVVSILIGGIVLLGVGFAAFVASPVATAILAGLGLAGIGLSMIGALIVVWLFGKALPALIRGFVALVKGIFGSFRRGVA